MASEHAQQQQRRRRQHRTPPLAKTTRMATAHSLTDTLPREIAVVADAVYVATCIDNDLTWAK